MWFDLSPMRPDEFARQQAAPWMDAQRDQVAYREGVELAREEIAAVAHAKARREQMNAAKPTKRRA